MCSSRQLRLQSYQSFVENKLILRPNQSCASLHIPALISSFLEFRKSFGKVRAFGSILYSSIPWSQSRGFKDSEFLRTACNDSSWNLDSPHLWVHTLGTVSVSSQPLLQDNGQSLPFRANTFGACAMAYLLQHAPLELKGEELNSLINSFFCYCVASRTTPILTSSLASSLFFLWFNVGLYWLQGHAYLLLFTFSALCQRTVDYAIYSLIIPPHSFYLKDYFLFVYYIL